MSRYAFALNSAMILLLLAPSGASADIGEVIATRGPWSIYRALDLMTDEPDCTAIYKTDGNIQLITDSLFITVRGRCGVSSVVLRFDDNDVLEGLNETIDLIMQALDNPTSIANPLNLPD